MPGEEALIAAPLTTNAARPPDAGGRPRLVEGVELIGEYEGSGFEEPPSLARRADGQVIQLTPLLYAVARHTDGRSGHADIARRVSTEIGRTLSAENVRFLLDEKLHPLGLVTRSDGAVPEVGKADPLLALKFRAAIIPEGASVAVARLFRPLFLPPVVVAVLAAFVAFDVWLFAVHGVAQSVRHTLYAPQYILLTFALVVLSAGFHEVGHAAGCAYGGGRPGKMGCGLYLAWPAFYTDVTDAYRLDRRGRLRTDLGGVYFNVIFAVGTAGVYLVTGFEPLLLVVVLQHFEMAHQLLPVVRLDGYYIVADLTGVPDLFTRIGPILRSMIPGRRPDAKVRVLKRWVRFAVTAWVLVVVPLLLFQLFMLLVHLPRILGTAWDSLNKQSGGMQRAFAEGDALAGLAGVVQILALALPVVGILLMLARTGARVSRSAWRRTDGRPAARTAVVVAGVVVAGGLGVAWLPKESYRPIREGERGTLAEGVVAVRRLPSGRAPLVSHERAGVRTTSPGAKADGAPTTTTTTPATTTPPPAGGTTATTVAPTSTTVRSTSTTARSASTTVPSTSTTRAPTTTSTSTTSTTATSGTTETTTP